MNRSSSPKTLSVVENYLKIVKIDKIQTIYLYLEFFGN